jgi:hypothetical protein
VIDDAQVFNDKLQEWEDFYNDHRPHGGLDGQTPYETLKQRTRPGCNPSPSLAHAGPLMLVRRFSTSSRPALQAASGPAATARTGLSAPRWAGWNQTGHRVESRRAAAPRRSPPQQPLRDPLLEGITRIRETSVWPRPLPPRAHDDVRAPTAPGRPTSALTSSCKEVGSRPQASP